MKFETTLDTDIVKYLDRLLGNITPEQEKELHDLEIFNVGDLLYLVKTNIDIDSFKSFGGINKEKLKYLLLYLKTVLKDDIQNLDLSLREMKNFVQKRNEEYTKSTGSFNIFKTNVDRNITRRGLVSRKFLSQKQASTRDQKIIFIDEMKEKSGIRKRKINWKMSLVVTSLCWLIFLMLKNETKLINEVKTFSSKTTQNCPPGSCCCPQTCTDSILDQEIDHHKKKKGSFTCRDRISFLMGRYGNSEREACINAAKQYSPCGNGCNPETCSIDPKKFQWGVMKILKTAVKTFSQKTVEEKVITSTSSPIGEKLKIDEISAKENVQKQVQEVENSIKIKKWDSWPAVAYEEVGHALVTKGDSFFHHARDLIFTKKKNGKALMDEFVEVYKERPDPTNMCGVRINHALALFFSVKQLQPTLVVESGVNAGVSTYFIRAASPTTKIFAIDPLPRPICKQGTRWIDSSNLTTNYMGDNFVDLLEIDWTSMISKKEVDPDKVLIFIDDHLHAFNRIVSLLKFGLRHFLVEDNYKLGEGMFIFYLL